MHGRSINNAPLNSRNVTYFPWKIPFAKLNAREYFQFEHLHPWKCLGCEFNENICFMSTRETAFSVNFFRKWSCRLNKFFFFIIYCQGAYKLICVPLKPFANPFGWNHQSIWTNISNKRQIKMITKLWQLNWFDFHV